MDPARFVPSTRPGTRAPHAWLDDERSTLDLFGDGFVLLRLGANPPDATRLIEAAKARGVPMRAVTLADPDVAALYETPPGAGAAGRPRRLARQRSARRCRGHR